MKNLRILIITAVLTLLVACGGRTSQQGNGSADYDLRMEPQSTAVGETTLRFILNDKNGQPINNAALSIKGDMNHAGMQPVLGQAAMGTNGVYEVPFEWTMGGDWTISVDVALADGTTFSQTFDTLSINAMSDKLVVMNVWGRPTTTGNNTAFYMDVSNGTTAEDALVGAAVPVCGAVELHESYDQGQGVMGMRPVDGQRVAVTAGGTEHLKPGGLHVMCMGTTQDLTIGDEVALTLTFEHAGEMVVTAAIQETAAMPMDHTSMDGMDMASDEHDHEHNHEEHMAEMATIPNNGAVITIVAPAAGTTFTTSDMVRVEIATENFDLSQDGNHWHIYLDDEAIEMIEGGASEYELELHGLTTGEHTIRVTMSNADHDELQDGASVVITVE